MRRFQIRDLVLRKVLHNKGALDPNWEGLYKIAGILIPNTYKLAYLNEDWVPRSWNTNHLKMYYQ